MSPHDFLVAAKKTIGLGDDLRIGPGGRKGTEETAGWYFVRDNFTAAAVTTTTWCR